MQRFRCSPTATTVVVGLILCGAFAGEAAGQVKPPSGGTATFVVRAYGTSRTGATPAGSAAGIGRILIGKSYVFGFSEKGFDGVGSSEWPLPAGFPFQLEAQPVRVRQYAWRVEVKLLSMQIDEARCELNWGRYDRLRSLSEPVAGGTSTLTLRVGQRHIVDLVHSSSPSSLLENVIVELSLDSMLDPAYSNVSFGCDVWLVHEDAAGHKTTRHVDVTAGQGEEKAFSFQPIGFTLDGAVDPVQDSRADLTDLARLLGERREPGAPAGYEAARLKLQELEERLATLAGRPTPPTVDLTVAGTVAARLRPDGSIEIGLRAERWMRCHGGGAGGGGLKAPSRFTVKPGETVAFQFPTYGVSCGMPSGTTMPQTGRQGVEVRNGIVWVDFKDFLGDQNTSLLLTVTRRR